MLLGPIHLVVNRELAHCDPQHEQQGRGHRHHIDEWRQRDVNACVEKTARMAVGALVVELVGRLKEEVRSVVLDKKDCDCGETENSNFAHEHQRLRGFRV